MATIEQPLVEQRFEHLVLDFLAYLEFERGLSRNTLEAYRTDLLQFGRFLARREMSALEAGPGDVADFLAELATGDVERPPASTATIHRKTACLRSFYRHLLELMYACGLRASEAIGLELTDVDLEERVLRARGKGSKERVVPIGQAALRALR